MLHFWKKCYTESAKTIKISVRGSCDIDERDSAELRRISRHGLQSAEWKRRYIQSNPGQNSAQAEEMGYMLNASARALKTNRTYSIGVLFIDSTSAGLAHESDQ